MRKLDWLENGKIEKPIAALRKLADAHTNAELVQAIRNEAEYFDANRDGMRYPEFRKRNLFVGSGVNEAGCKTVIGSRLKRSCSGPCVAPTRSSPYDAAVSAVNLKASGRTEPVESHFRVAHPSLPAHVFRVAGAVSERQPVTDQAELVEREQHDR